LRGHFHNFGYHHLGLFVFEFEQGTIFNSAGISTDDQLAVRTEQEHEAQIRQVLQWWDEQPAPEPLFADWKPFDHPQLGPVEIGGIRYPNWANPTQADLHRIAKGTYRFTLEHAAKHPWVQLEELSTTAVANGVYRIRARIANRGAFPTHVTNKGKSLKRLRPVRVEFYPSEGVKLLSAQGHLDLGHLSGVTDSRLVEWFVSAPHAPPELCEIRVLGGSGGNVSRTVSGAA
jgi:hypothetical protein